MKRKLNDLEYLNFSIGQPYNLVIVLRIKGFLSKDDLILALEKAQEKHPLLKVRIEGNEEDNYWFTSKNVGEIPLEITEFEDDAKTNKLFLKNLETSFDLDDPKKPLFRATLLNSLKRNDLILCAQHTITDGLSMVFLTRDLVQFINNPNIEVATISSPMNEDDIFPTKIRQKIPNSVFHTKILLFFLRIYYFLKYGKKRKDLYYDTDYKLNDLKLISWE